MSDEFRTTVERQFESIQRKLDRLDEAIRGTIGTIVEGDDSYVAILEL